MAANNNNNGIFYNIIFVITKEKKILKVKQKNTKQNYTDTLHWNIVFNYFLLSCWTNEMWSEKRNTKTHSQIRFALLKLKKVKKNLYNIK